MLTKASVIIINKIYNQLAASMSLIKLYLNKILKKLMKIEEKKEKSPEKTVHLSRLLERTQIIPRLTMEVGSEVIAGQQ